MSEALSRLISQEDHQYLLTLAEVFRLSKGYSGHRKQAIHAEAIRFFRELVKVFSLIEGEPLSKDEFSTALAGYVKASIKDRRAMGKPLDAIAADLYEELAADPEFKPRLMAQFKLTAATPR